MATGEEGASQFEAALLAVWPNSEGGARNWFTVTLGRLQSSAMLPELITALDAMPDQPLPTEKEGGMAWQFPHSVAKAVGYYADDTARAALWRLLERYPVNDRFIYNLIEELLRMWQLEGDSDHYTTHLKLSKL